MAEAFRCAVASIGRTEPLLATASVVRAFVLFEHPGSWGREALRDSRLPNSVRQRLADLSRYRIKTLLVRRHGRSPTSGGFRLFAAYASDSGSWLETGRLDSAEDLLDLDLARVAEGRSVGLPRASGPLVCVCTHGRHDPCCAERGRPVARALQAACDDLVWEASHLGGDRFAANLLILPEGLYYGRITVEEAPGVVRAHLSGDLTLDSWRGRSCYPLAVQAAEWHLRRQLDESRIDALRLLGTRRDGDITTASFRRGRVVWQVDVRSARRDPAPLTCGAERLLEAPAFALVRIRPGAAAADVPAGS